MNWDMLKTGAVDAAFTGWWSDEMHGAADVHGFAGAHHADDGAKAVPGSVIGWESGRGEEDDWDLLEAFVRSFSRWRRDPCRRCPDLRLR
jgi:hypothetical protein